MSEREIVFWGWEDDESLSHYDKDEAIEAMLDGMDEPIAALPETIEVCGFARMEIHPNVLSADAILEDALERLDEEYADPHGEIEEPTPAMKTAAEAFVAVIKAEYMVWNCEVVARETVNVREWIKEHRPDWLEPTP